MAQRLAQSARQKQSGVRPILTAEALRKMSEAGLRRPSHEHPRWKGGVTRERQGRLVVRWARDVKKRDAFTCQICGHRGGRMHAHHIWSFADFPSKRYDIDNGITLCADCHYRKPVHRVPKTLADLMFLDINQPAPPHPKTEVPEQPAESY